MRSAFVFGKFLPFHKGHEAMIRFALTRCDALSVLVCVSDLEKLSGVIRKDWIEKTFSKQKNISVEIFDYQENELPNTSESSESVSKVWAELFKRKFPTHELVITSEPYGEYVARFMNIKHLAFDPPRNLVPVSATKIRTDLFENWNYLPDAVKSYFAIKVVILGTESTGKSTLTKKLAQHFNCTYVTEAGRDLIPDSREFAFEDLATVATEHARRINEAVTESSPLIIIDTDIHITKSYAQFCFQKELKVPQIILDANRATLYLYLNHDVPHIQDGTRMTKNGRDRLDLSHRKTLIDNQIKLVEITGNYDHRLLVAKKEIIALINKINLEKVLH